MIRRILVFTAVMIFLAVPFASGVDTAPKVSVGPRGEVPSKLAAPDFTLQDLSGKTWKLSDYKGKVVMLDFTTTWCPWCVKDIPHLKKLSETYKGPGFEFVAVYLNESKQKVASFAGKKGITYKILLDQDGRVAKSYGVRGVPTKVIVGRDGNMVCWMCSDEDDQLEKLLKK